MKKILIIFSGCGILLIAIFFLVKAFLPYSINTIKLGVGFSAKEFCSCLYVIGQEEKECRATSQGQDMITITLEENKENREIQASFYGITRRASFVGERHGCQLTF